MTKSEQARADALADAKTLRLVHEDVRPDRPGYHEMDQDTGRTRRRMPQRYLPCRDIETIRYQSPEVAAHIAQVVARAAFRAVPGLRG